ncbi:MAG: hypothetical protein OEU26_31210, partial [Candidatus Tectomicrobia bacterium]|nr:hypothetical protein [Candidatus Tectomicrobia bacterium]
WQLGQLPAAMQQVLEVASVVGETFTSAAVAAGMEDEPEAIDKLCATVARLGGFLEADGLASWPDGTVSGQYHFTHELVRQVAYEQVGIGPRTVLHVRIGARLEKAYGTQAGDIATTLAVHFLQGHDIPRAIQHLQMAAEQTLLRSAYRETITHCTRALELLPSLPETPERAQRELDVLIMLRSALVPIKGYRAREVADIYRRARDLCDHLDEGPQRALALGGAVRFYWHIRTEVQPALELAEQQLRLAERLHDPTLLLRAHGNLGPLLFTAGDLPLARDRLEQAIRLCDTQSLPTARPPVGWSNYSVESRGYLAFTLWHLGYPDQALARARDALSLVQDSEQPFRLALALTFASTLCRLRGESQAALEHAESLLTLAMEQDYPHWVAIGTILRGSALADIGQGDEAIALMHQGIEAHRNLTLLGLVRYLCRLAEIYGQVGRMAEGLEVIAEAESLVERTGEQVHVSEIHRLQGDLLRSRSFADYAKAESCFQHALDVSRSQHAKSLELRATTSLGRLWRQQGKHDDACELLAPVYHWFTEGFDTADLQEAKGLLEAMW